MLNIRPVILSGGSGTRLWPLSTPELPKQFAPLIPGAPLFERTLLRLARLEEAGAPIVVTGESQMELVETVATHSGVAIDLIIVEPEGRNTAPACLAAALGADPSDILAILPSDHLIDDEEGFARAILRAAAVASRGHLVTFGVKPHSAETGYGYIETGEDVDGALRVRRFKEKPTSEEAERLVAEGNYLWNSGMFVANASLLVEEAATHHPRLLEGVRASMSPPEDGILKLGPGFGEVEKISLDHAIMEKTNRAAVLPLDVGWDDVGSFDALWAVSAKDEAGNSISGDVIADDVKGSLIRATSRTVAVSGLDDVVVVETPDAVLVVPRHLSQQVRFLLDRLGED